MDIEEVRELSTDEIQTRIYDERENLMKLRFQTATGELTDTNQLRIARRMVARLLTILQEKQNELEGEV